MNPLFPFRKTFRKRQLQQRWWHRLCVVLFFVSFVLLAAVSGLYLFTEGFTYYDVNTVATRLGFNAGNEIYTFDVHERFTYNFTEEERTSSIFPMILPDGTKGGVPRNEVAKAEKVGFKKNFTQVDVPGVGIVTFARMSEPDISKKCKELYDAIQKAKHEAYFRMTIGWILLLLAYSYLLQVLYRTTLYVTFGSLETERQPEPQAVTKE